MSSSYTHNDHAYAGGSYASYQGGTSHNHSQNQSYNHGPSSSSTSSSPYTSASQPPPSSYAPDGTSRLARDGTQRTAQTHTSRQSSRYTEGAPTTTKTRSNGDRASRSGGTTSNVSRGLALPLSTPRQLGTGLIPSRSSAWFLLVVVLESLTVIGLVAAVFGIVEVRTETLSQDAKTVPVFLALLVFGFLFFIVMALDAFRLHNTIQIYGCLILNLALLITAALQISQVRDAFVNQDEAGLGVPCVNRRSRRCNAVRTLYPDIEPLLIAVPVVVGVAQGPLTYFTLKLSQDFGWEIYRKIGADLRKRRMMLVYQIFVCFLKYTGFFGLAFCIAYLILVSKRHDVEFALTIAAIPAAIVVLFLSAIAVQKELRSLMSFCVLCMLAGIAYFIFKITRIFEPETEQQYRTVRLSLTFFSVLSILSLLTTLALAIVCTLNFGKGLKEAHETMGGLLGTFNRRAARRRQDEAQPVEIEAGEKEGEEVSGSGDGRLAGVGEEDEEDDEAAESRSSLGRAGRGQGQEQGATATVAPAAATGGASYSSYEPPLQQHQDHPYYPASSTLDSPHHPSMSTTTPGTGYSSTSSPTSARPSRALPYSNQEDEAITGRHGARAQSGYAPSFLSNTTGNTHTTASGRRTSGTGRGPLPPVPMPTAGAQAGAGQGAAPALQRRISLD
ncbi:hypothetical protein BCV69DRAFT_283160 [Microstroma glucosiphilum]|uniref:TRP C-terminal domain-containing protein n=1 Tax=Pseudomicrostroma glucosiphilum TaxID=1684307 RepID=A0A316U625_9BASI|nr:hypothetical protein BCV69DRAFT_283160 [Pseudomicrostroma glucosiphilum]PWN20284.1 hypothetical protein BCV69DRAFT_283160 [Pseudomicrostroma glucosiphilum]